MRKIRYRVAMSLDGYIAGPKDEFDWIVTDPDVDFGVVFKQFDTLLIGRRTFEVMAKHGNTAIPGMKTIVFSRTLQQSEYPDITIVAEGCEKTAATLREKRGKDIWLFGGGSLFQSFLGAGLVDTVEVEVIPVLLGEGIPLLPSPAKYAKLKLTSHNVYKSGRVSLQYAVKESTYKVRAV
jgi:dihydrofolate reductase